MFECITLRGEALESYMRVALSKISSTAARDVGCDSSYSVNDIFKNVVFQLAYNDFWSMCNKYYGKEWQDDRRVILIADMINDYADKVSDYADLDMWLGEPDAEDFSEED